MAQAFAKLGEPLKLPCGVVLRNRITKSAMSDSLGDGCGNPTAAQIRLYERWDEGGVALSIIGELQGNSAAAEKPGNLVLTADADTTMFETLAQRGGGGEARLWVQLGHAGAMAYPPISTPKGPSAVNIPGLQCAALSAEEIRQLPAEFARTASLARRLGFGGVQIHAAHGFLLSQFLSPLFNQRTDGYGGSIENRMRLLLEVIEAVRESVGPEYPVAVKLNSSDQLEGGLQEHEALAVVAALDRTSVDLLDISGGTYFPGAKSASDSAGGGPYFLDFAKHARTLTSKPIMLTGGFKTRQQAVDALGAGIDVIGLARALVLDPELPGKWLAGTTENPEFPRFSAPAEGAVTAWYTMRLTAIGEDRDDRQPLDLGTAVSSYQARDADRVVLWRKRFST